MTAGIEIEHLLDGEDGPTIVDEVMVRGWHPNTGPTAGDVLEAVADHINTHGVLDDDVETGDLRIERLMWGRMNPGDEEDDPWTFESTARPPVSDGRGLWSKYTQVVRAAIADAEYERRREQAEREAHLRAMLAAWLPEATDVRANVFRVGQQSVTFRLPGLAHQVTWSSDRPDSVQVHPNDFDAWDAYRGRDARPGGPCGLWTADDGAEVST